MKRNVKKVKAVRSRRLKPKPLRKPARESAKGAMSREPRRRYFIHDGLRLHYWEWGDPNEETYVFVHGVRDQGRSWDPFLAALLARGVPIKHAVAIDLRGHGDSEWPATSRGYQHEDFLSDLAGLLKHLDKEPLTIIGHSLGGSMCMLYAGAFPEKVKRMVLLESLGPFARADDEVPNIMAERLKGRDYVEIPFPYDSLEAAAKALQKAFPLIPDDAALHMARHGTNYKGGKYRWKHDPILRYRTTTAMSEGQIEAFIRRLQCPILFVYGTESGFMKSVRGPRAKLFTNAKIVPVAGAGHHIPHEKPAQLADIVAPFLIKD
ncbi:MAG: alpha/beta hydrolase [Deltaproteobacteria bacterium]|nr:alpha/beta hydrolase [Deltaproteobacteria bacterium]MBI2365264.1 alpha/beta hydrolase [Deltaproteobacteria bacterium]MBI2533539.1 alpha/beta hydrolase [Deltaproteobacteria bacterium]